MKHSNTCTFKPIFSFKALKERYKILSTSKSKIIKKQANEVLAILDKNPILVEGIESLEVFEKHKDIINEVMVFLFPTALNENEIKAAILPFSNKVFYSTNRLDSLLNDSSVNIDNLYKNMSQNSGEYIDFITYAIILNKYYKFNIDFNRPIQVQFTNSDGHIKTYRAAYNDDFLEIYPNKNAVAITDEILTELLSNTNDKDVWDKYFPENSWTIKGFGILNMIDTTLDEQIDLFKTHLIEPEERSYEKIINDIKQILSIDDLIVGGYYLHGDDILPVFEKNTVSITFDSEKIPTKKEYACKHVYETLFTNQLPVVISNVEFYHKRIKGNRLSKILIKKDIKSLALLPMDLGGGLKYIHELGSKHTNRLNAINLVKLKKLMPFMQSFSERAIKARTNEISAIIQRECTSIHPSVQWRFEEEAEVFLDKLEIGESPTFHEIVFADVMPLYGQIDISGSSNARNNAIQEDLSNLLRQSISVFEALTQERKLPFYDQLAFQANKYLLELENNFNASSEQQIQSFFSNQLLPLFNHINEFEKKVSGISELLESLDPKKKTLYKARKAYDQTVDIINKDLSDFLSKQQVKAQEIFPHYFEKFKTDGIEHNLYVGQSIAPQKAYHSSVLYNLRIWQLQVMCEMEAMYYNKREDYSVQFEVASLILSHDVPLTIRYRIDEKQFDVDGAYNVRYELVKKRIDKAHIKGTKERITKPKKLVVVYSNISTEREYLNYFEFLQSQNYLGDEIEIVELEDLQGASGIKALRVDINHNLNKSENLFSLKDLKINN